MLCNIRSANGVKTGEFFQILFFHKMIVSRLVYFFPTLDENLCARFPNALQSPFCVIKIIVKNYCVITTGIMKLYVIRFSIYLIFVETLWKIFSLFPKKFTFSQKLLYLIFSMVQLEIRSLPCFCVIC